MRSFVLSIKMRSQRLEVLELVFEIATTEKCRRFICLQDRIQEILTTLL